MVELFRREAAAVVILLLLGGISDAELLVGVEYVLAYAMGIGVNDC
jgi:hypothetical protein